MFRVNHDALFVGGYQRTAASRYERFNEEVQRDGEDRLPGRTGVLETVADGG